MLELQIEQDELLELEQEQENTLTFHTTIDTIDFKNIEGNVEDNQTLVDYIDENGGKIDKIFVNNVEQTITDKKVYLTTPTKTSDLQNDSEFVNQDDLDTKQDVITSETEIDIKKVNFGDGMFVDKETLANTETAITSLIVDVDDINDLIPSEASATNQLADKEYVDTHTPTLESFCLEIDWNNSQKSLATINGTLEDIG